jgi:hypothetical protein
MKIAMFLIPGILGLLLVLAIVAKHARAARRRNRIWVATKRPGYETGTFRSVKAATRIYLEACRANANTAQIFRVERQDRNNSVIQLLEPDGTLNTEWSFSGVPDSMSALSANVFRSLKYHR